jgi:hypothetical protein
MTDAADQTGTPFDCRRPQDRPRGATREISGENRPQEAQGASNTDNTL